MPRKKKVQAKDDATITDEATVKLEDNDETGKENDGSEGVAEQVKEPEIELVSEKVRYEFSTDELLKLADSTAEFIYRKTRLEEEAKSIAKDYKSQISRIELDANEVLQAYRDKFEMREMDCYCVKDYKNRKAYYLRADQIELQRLQAYEKSLLLDLLLTDNFPVEPAKIRTIANWELQRELPLEDQNESIPGDEEETEDKSEEF